MLIRAVGAWWGLFFAAARGATITVTNFDGPDSHLLTKDDGSLFFNGLVWIGAFDIDNGAIRDAVEGGHLLHLESQFRQFGNSIAVNFNGLPSLYQDVVTQTVTPEDEFAGHAIYTVISDQGLLRDARQLLIFQHDQVFLEDPLRNDPALLDDESGELLVGEFDLYRRSLDQIMEQPTYSLARTIPEPTVSSLLLLGWVVVARRRRSRRHDDSLSLVLSENIT